MHWHRIAWPCLVAMAGLMAGCNGPADESGSLASRPATAVIAQPVEMASFASGIEALGTARSNESLDVSANLTEKIISLDFDDGSDVKQGALLARLDDTAERAALAAAKARLAERRRTLERSRSLVSDRVLSESEVDLRASEVETAVAEVAELEALISDHQIRAPFDGRVGLRMVSVGALIRPGDVITTLDDIDTIKVDFTVPETELARLKPGVPLVARASAYPDRRFEGEVSAVDTQVNPQTRSVLARAVIDNRERVLQPGMLIELEVLARQRQSLAIPESALVPRGERQFVFRIIDGKAERVEVTVGTRQPGVAEITDGLQAGDVVVTDGTIKLQPGTTVEVTERSAVLPSRSSATEN